MLVALSRVAIKCIGKIELKLVQAMTNKLKEETLCEKNIGSIGNPIYVLIQCIIVMFFSCGVKS